jgi:hypothetical protein
MLVKKLALLVAMISPANAKNASLRNSLFNAVLSFKGFFVV